jgi:hypothetical protein
MLASPGSLAGERLDRTLGVLERKSCVCIFSSGTRPDSISRIAAA